MDFTALETNHTEAFQFNLLIGDDEEHTFVVDFDMPMFYGTCFGCQEMTLRLASNAGGTIRLDALHDTASKLCGLLGVPTAPDAGLVVLRAGGSATFCGVSKQLTAGVSAYSRWQALEREAAGPVPAPYESCFVRSPTCKVGDYETVCRDKAGVFFVLPGRQPDGAGSPCMNPARPFLTGAWPIP